MIKTDFSLRHSTSFIFAVLYLLISDNVDAKSDFGGYCAVYANDNGKYFEGALGHQKCNTGLVCITEVDDGQVGVDFDGTCELETCYGSLQGNGNYAGTVGKVTICHRTCSETNPWVRITVDQSAWDDAACKHGQHEVENCNGKDSTFWGDNQADYILKQHGSMDEVAASLGFSNTAISAYWNHWQSACPAVRNQECCDFDGPYGYSCCPGGGDPNPEDFTNAPTKAPITTNAPTNAPIVTPAPVQVTSAPTTPSPSVAPSTKAPVEPGSNCRRRHLQLSTLDEKWAINTEPTFQYTDLSFTLDFEVGDAIQDQGQVQYTLYDVTCTIPYTGPSLNGTVLPLYDGGVDGKQNAPVTIVIDSSTISEDNQVYTEDAPVSGPVTAGVDFCMRFSLHTPPDAEAEDIEVNFLEVVILLDVELTDGFQIGAITVTPFDPCEFQANDAFEVEGYFCESGKEAEKIDTLPTLNQGSVVKICVRPSQEARDLSIRMRNIRSFTFTSLDGLEQQAIIDYEAAPNGLTQLWCDAGFAICHFETILNANFFARPGVVSGFGVADMQFGGESSESSVTPEQRRRMMRKGSDPLLLPTTSSLTTRTLQATEAAGSGEFGMEFDTQGVSNNYSDISRDDTGSTKVESWVILLAGSLLAAMLVALQFASERGLPPDPSHKHTT